MDKGKGSIEVNGKPLEEYLQDEIGKEARRELNGTLRERESWRPRRVRKYLPKTGRSGRARRLTQREIRRIDPMAFTLIEKLIQCVKENGPMTAREISEKMKIKPRDAATMSYRLSTTIPGLFERRSETIPYRYQIAATNLTVPEIYKEYRVAKKTQSADKFPDLVPAKGKITFTGVFQKDAVEIPIELKIIVSVEVKK